MRTLEEKHPVVIALYFLAVCGIGMFCPHPVIQGLSLIGAVCFFLVRNGTRHAVQHLSALVLFVMISLINPLVSHNGVTVLFVLNGNPVTLEAFLYGIQAAVMISAVLYWLRSFSLIMTSEKLLCIFGAISPGIALVLSMTLRFVPLFQAQSRKVSQAQKAVGYYRSDNLPDRIRERARIFDTVLTWGLENGIITANSMTARGADAGRRTHFSIHPIRRDDLVLGALTGIPAAVCIAAAASGHLSFSFYPALQELAWDAPAAAGCIAFGFLCLLPSILQAEVNLRWRFLRSKI